MSGCGAGVKLALFGMALNCRYEREAGVKQGIDDGVLGSENSVKEGSRRM